MLALEKNLVDFSKLRTNWGFFYYVLFVYFPIFVLLFDDFTVNDFLLIDLFFISY